MSDWNSTMPRTRRSRHVADQPVDRLELAPARAVEQRDEHAAAERHLHRARAANQLQDLVDQDRHHEDVGEIPPADREDGARNDGDTSLRMADGRADQPRSRVSLGHPTTCAISATACTRTMCAPAEHGGRHRRRRAPVALGRRPAADRVAQERLARRPDEHRAVERRARARAAAPAHHNCAPAVWQTRCPGRR